MTDYLHIIWLSKTTEGDPIYVAKTPDLPGCIVQGETMQDAWDSLIGFQADYNEHMLVHNIPVPMPTVIQSEVPIIIDLGED